jgi:hypothetical protein
MRDTFAQNRLDYGGWCWSAKLSFNAAASSKIIQLADVRFVP